MNCTHLIKWTNKTHIGKRAKVLSNNLYAVSRAWTSLSKWPTPEVFINVCIEWEQKEKEQVRSSLSPSFNHHQVLFFDRVSFSFVLISFISIKKIASIIYCPHACSIVVISINNIYLYVYRNVWSSLVNANRRLIICLSVAVHVI